MVPLAPSAGGAAWLSRLHTLVAMSKFAAPFSHVIVEHIRSHAEECMATSILTHAVHYANIGS